MKTVLFITPHLSTGGCPQYLLKKIELLKDTYEIFIVEYSYIAPAFVVQRNKVIDLCSSNFYSLGEDKMGLLNIIDAVRPDIIHIEEIPEYFMDSKLADHVYRKDRPYKLFETSHDSSVNIESKRYIPDGFLLVSQYQIEQFKVLNVPCKLIEYPIEYKESRDRQRACQQLGLDPNLKHVINVGLFTSRKNQAEVIEYAKQLREYPIQFHFIGNQADNFRHYWEPLMQNFPENCKWWGERSDVDTFYQAADLFLFTSRGHENDKETMPLVIREAISWKLPMLIYDLSVYLSYFDKFDNVDYLNFEDLSSNRSNILKKLGFNKKKNECIVISTYPTTKSSFTTTVECIRAAKSTGRLVILASHLPISLELQEMVDYCVYDKNNILTKHTFYSQSRYSEDSFYAFVNLRAEDNDIYHGPACYTNYYNGAALAYKLGIDKAYFINYDYIIKDESYLDKISKILDSKLAYFGDMPNNQEGHSVATFFMGINPKFYLDIVPHIRCAEDYEKLREKFGSYSNGYENLMYFAFENSMQSIELVDESIFNDEIKNNFYHRDYSMVEYFTVLPSNISNSFVAYLQISNSIDSRSINIKVFKNNYLVSDEKLLVTGKGWWYHIFDYSIDTDDVYTVEYTSFDLETMKEIDSKKIIVDSNYLTSVLSNNGLFTYYGEIENANRCKTSFKKSNKIKVIHLVTEPEKNIKEKRSVESITSFCNTFDDIEYCQTINDVYKDLPPSYNCNRPEDISIEPGHMKLSPGHYGCYLAHKNGIESSNNLDYDIVLVFEGDAIIDTDYYELYYNLIRWSYMIKNEDIDILGFGNYVDAGEYVKLDDLLLTNRFFIPAHAYLINTDRISRVVEKLNTTKWDAFDLWITSCANLNCAIADKIYVKQISGYSLIDKKEKNENNSLSGIYIN